MGDSMNEIIFVGAGPGDPELITVKGANALKKADIVVYAGSLVNPEILSYCRDDCKIYDSAKMHLEEIITVMVEGVRKGLVVVRLHTGDFSIYGSLREQIECLTKEQVGVQLISGVSSFLGAASSLGVEYTVPEISQTVIITRIAGRTPVPEKESLRALAAHQATMCIFLSANRIKDVVQEVRAAGLPANTPAAVIYRATWKDEKMVRGTLEDIAEKTISAGITKHALIIIGHALGKEFYYSKLYDKTFGTAYRHAHD